MSNFRNVHWHHLGAGMDSGLHHGLHSWASCFHSWVFGCTQHHDIIFPHFSEKLLLTQGLLLTVTLT